MVDFKENDFISVNYDLYANDKLVQSTNEKIGKENNLEAKEYGAQTMILGKGFLLKGLDDDIIKQKGKDNSISLKTEDAFGKRDKKLIKTFTKRVFDEQKLRAVPGMVYDFNGMYGTVKSVVGGRVMVDFNNPLSGKDVKIDYKNVKKVTDMTVKISLIMETVLRIPKNMFKVEVKEKNITLLVPEQLIMMKDQLIKTFEETISDFKDYKLKFDVLKVEAKK